MSIYGFGSKFERRVNKVINDYRVWGMDGQTPIADAISSLVSRIEDLEKHLGIERGYTSRSKKNA